MSRAKGDLDDVVQPSNRNREDASLEEAVSELTRSVLTPAAHPSPSSTDAAVSHTEGDLFGVSHPIDLGRSEGTLPLAAPSELTRTVRSPANNLAGPTTEAGVVTASLELNGSIAWNGDTVVQMATVSLSQLAAAVLPPASHRPIPTTCAGEACPRGHLFDVIQPDDLHRPITVLPRAIADFEVEVLTPAPKTTVAMDGAGVPPTSGDPDDPFESTDLTGSSSKTPRTVTDLTKVPAPPARNATGEAKHTAMPAPDDDFPGIVDPFDLGWRVTVFDRPVA